MANVYLASRYGRRDELRRYAEHLRAAGHTVTAGWLADDAPTPAAGADHDIGSQGLSDGMRQIIAVGDLMDVEASDIVVSFTEPPVAGSQRGGRHVEFGVAVALGARLIVVGPAENVFHCLPAVERFDDWPAALAAINGGGS